MTETLQPENEILEPETTPETETQEPEITPETEPEKPKKGRGRPPKDATKTDEIGDVTEIKTGGEVETFKRKRTRNKVQADDLINEAEKERKITPAEKKNILESYRSGGKVFLSTFDILQAKLFAYLHEEDTKDHMLTDDEKELIQVPLDDVIKDLAEKANGVLNPYWLLFGVIGMIFLPKIILVGDKKGWFDMKNFSKKKKSKSNESEQNNAFFDEIQREREIIRQEHLRKQEAELIEKARLEAERIAKQAQQDAEIEQMINPKMKVVHGDSE